MVEKSGVESSGVEKSGVEMSFNLLLHIFVGSKIKILASCFNFRDFFIKKTGSFLKSSNFELGQS